MTMRGTRKKESDKYLELRELGAFLHAARDVEHDKVAYVLFSIQYLLGARIGEACRLRYEHLGPLEVKTGLPIYVNVPTLKKGGAKEKNLPPTMAVPVLGSPALMAYAFNRSWRDKDARKSPWLFPGQDSRHPLSVKTAIRWFHNIAETAGLRSELTPHAMRHSAATRLSEACGDRMRLVTAFLRQTPGTGFNSANADGAAAVSSRYVHVSQETWQRYPGVLDLPPLRPLVNRAARW
jgi:integrase